MASFAKAGAMIFLGAPRTQAAAQRARMRKLDARADAGAGGCVRGARACANIILAGGVPRGGSVASRMDADWKRPRNCSTWGRRKRR